MKIYLSPSDQTRNTYATGNTTEAIQCRSIADAAQAALERCGFTVKNNQTGSMAARVNESNAWGADLHVCIHTNACNGKVMGTRAFAWDTAGKGYKATKAIFDVLAPITPGTSENITANQSLFEIKNTTAPCAYIECEFHDTATGAKWIIEYVTEIGEAICKGICHYFNRKFITAAQTPAQKLEPTQTSQTTQTTPNTATNTKEECEVKLPVLYKGWSGGYVRTLQILLNAYNNAGLTVDGVFGAATDNAVRAYQKSRKLTVDGVVGEKTWAQLLK